VNERERLREERIAVGDNLEEGIVLMAVDGEINRVVCTNLKWLLTDGYYHRWGELSGASLNLAQEIIENVLQHEGYEGARLDYGKRFYGVEGELYCYHHTWRLGYQLRSEILVHLDPEDGHTFDYEEIRDWIMSRVETLDKEKRE